MSQGNIKYDTSTIAEMTNGIILANFEKANSVRETSYQSEAELEVDIIDNLVSQGYQRLVVKTKEDLYANLKVNLRLMSGVGFLLNI